MPKQSKYAPYVEEILNGTIPVQEIATQLSVSVDAVHMARKRLRNSQTFKNTNKTWRVNNADKISEINRNYRSQSCENATNIGEEWTEHEDRMILKGPLKGLALAAALGRTLDAIYIRRYRLRAKGITAETFK